MNINTQYQENITPCYLTKLPTILWSLAASYLSLKDLGRLSLTHSVFIEALSKLTDDQKKFLEQCRKYPKFPHNFSFFMTDRSPQFSLPVILQLKSLTSLEESMIEKYELSVKVTNHVDGNKVLSKCVSLKTICLQKKPYRLEGLKVCQSLKELKMRTDYEGPLNSFLQINGTNLEKLTLECLRPPYTSLDSIILNCPNLNNLTINTYYLRNALELASLPNLTALTVRGTCLDLNLEDLIPLISSREMSIINVHSKIPLTQKYIDALANNSNKLEHLCLSQQYVENGHIQPLSFGYLLSNLKNITFLNLNSCEITNADLQILNDNAHHLNYLYLKDNSVITFETLKNLIENLPLKQLNVFDCSNINGESFRAFKEKKGIY